MAKGLIFKQTNIQPALRPTFIVIDIYIFIKNLKLAYSEIQSNKSIILYGHYIGQNISN